MEHQRCVQCTCFPLYNAGTMIGPILLAAVAGAADFLGAVLAMAPVRISGHAILCLMGVSGGYMLTWAVADLIPLLIGHHASLATWILAGYFSLYVMENLFASHAHRPAITGDLHGHALVDSWAGHTAVISPAACWAGVAGLLIHAFFDGFGIVASFTIQQTLGVMVCIAVLIHKIPEGSSLTSLLGAARQSSSLIIAAAAGTALMTVIGGIAASQIGLVQPEWAYPMLALSAGTFLFIGASNLIPATQKGESKGMVFAVIAGALAFYAVNQLLHVTGVHV